MDESTSTGRPPRSRSPLWPTIGSNQTRSDQPHRSPRLAAATRRSIPGSLDDSVSADARTPHRFPGPNHTPPPIARAHPNQHSYAETPLGPPTSVALPARTNFLTATHRSHVSEAPAPHTV